MPLLPMPVDDEHLLSLVHGYMRLNSCVNRQKFFGYAHRLIFVNCGFNYHYVKAAALFTPLVPVESFLDSYGLNRLHKPYMKANRYWAGITGRNLGQRSLAKAASNGRQQVRDVAYFWFCPLCRAHDIATVGYARWRRSHQVSGVQVCPTHACRLIKSCTNCGDCPGAITEPECDSVRCAQCNAKYPVHQLEGAHPDRLLLFAHFIQALLQDRVPCHDAQIFITLLEAKAMERYGVRKGGVPSRLRRAVEVTFDDGLLRALGLHPREGKSAGWIRWFFSGYGYGDNYRAYALIGAVVFSSIDEWMDAYALVSRMPSVKYRAERFAVIPLDARLLRDLAWQSDLTSIGYCEEMLRFAITHVPGLSQVRSTKLIYAKQELLEVKKRWLQDILQTRSKHTVLAALYRAERQTMGSGRKILEATLETIAYRWYRLYGDEYPMPAEHRIRLYGEKAKEVIAQAHENRCSNQSEPRYCSAMSVNAMQKRPQDGDTDEWHHPAYPVIDHQIEVFTQDCLTVLGDE